MKKILVAFMLCSFALYGETPKYSHTFLFTRPAQQNLPLRQSVWHDILFNKKQKFSIDVAVFGQNSGYSKDIAQYFLPPNRSTLLVNSTALDRDVLPYWLGLPEAFSGKLTLAPKQSQAGGLIEGRLNLGDILKVGDVMGVNFLENWSVFASIAIINAKNNLHLTQSDIINAASPALPVYDILTAFNNPTWKNDKINGQEKVTGVSEIRIGLATTLISTERAHAATYSCMTFPTKLKQSNEYLFNAFNGYGHVGLVWGISFYVPFNRPTDSYKIALTLNFENIFLMKSYQYRTFDLNNKPWSRFMLMRKKNDPSGLLYPGVNVLTHKLKVHPHSIIDFSSGFRVTSGYFQAEAGFALWAAGGEKCEILHDSWIADYGIAGTELNTSANESTISHRAPNDPVFITIVENNLDLHSCSQPPNLVYKAYGTVGLQNMGQHGSFDFTIGAYKEFPHNKTDALGTWGIWVTSGAAF